MILGIEFIILGFERKKIRKKISLVQPQVYFHKTKPLIHIGKDLILLFLIINESIDRFVANRLNRKFISQWVISLGTFFPGLNLERLK